MQKYFYDKQEFHSYGKPYICFYLGSVIIETSRSD